MSKAHASPEGPAQLGMGWERPFEVNDTTSRTVCSLLVSRVELICRGLVWQLGNPSARKEIFSFIFPEGIGKGTLGTGLWFSRDSCPPLLHSPGKPDNINASPLILVQPT